jgi:hypothetical protein
MRKRGVDHGDMMLFSLVTTIAIEFGEALLRVKLQVLFLPEFYYFEWLALWCKEVAVRGFADRFSSGA